MSLSLGHLLVVLVLVLLLFGRGRISEIMGDFGKGIRNLRDGISGDEGKQEVLPPEDNEKK